MQRTARRFSILYIGLLIVFVAFGPVIGDEIVLFTIEDPKLTLGVTETCNQNQGSVLENDILLSCMDVARVP